MVNKPFIRPEGHFLGKKHVALYGFWPMVSFCPLLGLGFHKHAGKHLTWKVQDALVLSEGFALHSQLVIASTRWDPSSFKWRNKVLQMAL